MIIVYHCEGRVRVKRFGCKMSIAIALAVALPVNVEAVSPPPEALAAQKGASINSAVSTFYMDRAQGSFWLSPQAGDAANQLIRLLATAEADGVSPEQFQPGSLLVAIRAARSGDAAAINQAERMLSVAFVNYAQALQRDPKIGIVYVDPELKPKPASADSLLGAAAQAASLPAYVRELGWMNPYYGKLRGALLRNRAANERELLKVNLERARALPPRGTRHILVNTANQRLYMYEDDKIVDEMKVVAGRVDAQTPLMNAYVRHAVLNPYWNVPADIASRLAANAVKQGRGYLAERGYQLVSSPDGPPLRNPEQISWKAVAAGNVQVHLRQLPGPANAMGRVKFMFPNSQGIWLHDTPSRHLLDKKMRLESNGCVRLEDAWRVGAWLFGEPLDRAEKRFEHKVEMLEPVPVYITYLTAIPRGEAIDYAPDVYRRDFPAFIDNPNAYSAGRRRFSTADWPHGSDHR